MDLIYENLIQELKRGTQVLSVLKLLEEKQYGYMLLQKLNSKNIDIEVGTLYPLLRRLESQSLLMSTWDNSEKRPRKYYEISDYGKNVLKNLTHEWNKIVDDLSKVLKE